MIIDSIHNTQTDHCLTGKCTPPTELQAPAPNSPAPQSVDTVQISQQGREKSAENAAEAGVKPSEADLDEQEKRDVENLKKTDQEVKAHERAHMAAGAGLVVGGASYQYQRGPDGKMYAVSGEVKIDTSREKEPEDTIRKMQQVKRAALAPSQPSGQDRSVAARASQIEAEARAELQKENSEKLKEENTSDEKSNGARTAESFKPFDSSFSKPTIRIVA